MSKILLVFSCIGFVFSSLGFSLSFTLRVCSEKSKRQDLFLNLTFVFGVLILLFLFVWLVG